MSQAAFDNALRDMANAVIHLHGTGATLEADATRSIARAMDWAPFVASAESFTVTRGNPLRFVVGQLDVRGPTRGAAYRIASHLWSYRQYLPVELQPSGPPTPVIPQA